jgi:hypothetical protein
MRRWLAVPGLPSAGPLVALAGRWLSSFTLAATEVVSARFSFRAVAERHACHGRPEIAVAKAIWPKKQA